MPVEFITRSQNLPINLEALKEHLRLKVDADDVYELEDSVLTLMIEAGCEAFEEVTKTVLLNSQMKFTYTHFKRIMEMPRPPLVQVDSVRYLAEGDTEFTIVATEEYFDLPVTKRAVPGKLVLSEDFMNSRPVLSKSHPYPVEFIYTAGYGAAFSDLPAKVILYIMNTIGTYYMQRESELINYTGAITVVQMKQTMAGLLRGHNAANRFG